MDLRKVDLDKLNTATKYPSIATFHALGERGRLTDEITGFDLDSDATVFAREKVDGSNARIIMCGDQWIIGSREELLCADGDLIFNPSQRIVEALRPVAERMIKREAGRASVYYFEVYGGKVGRNGKNYTGDGSLGSRLFDVMLMDNPWFRVMLRDCERSDIAERRDTGAEFPGHFVAQDTLEILAERDGLHLVPNLGHFPLYSLPRTIEGTYDWLAAMLPGTRAHLDGGHGRAEGLILRTDTPEGTRRQEIRKLRFEDYARTLKHRE
jgi:hypothetical protein